MMKNQVQALGVETGIALTLMQKKDLFSPRTGAPLSREVKLLLPIKGVTFLMAVAFLADVGDVRRFRALRKMNACLGQVPRLRESGAKSHVGHINRASRSLTRMLCGVMRQMLLTGETFREIQADLCAEKLRLYERRLEDLKGEQKSA